MYIDAVYRKTNIRFVFIEPVEKLGFKTNIQDNEPNFIIKLIHLKTCFFDKNSF